MYKRAVGTVGSARCPYKAEVAGSNPAPPIHRESGGRSVAWFNMSACQAEDREFKSRRPRLTNVYLNLYL